MIVASGSTQVVRYQGDKAGVRQRLAGNKRHKDMILHRLPGLLCLFMKLSDRGYR